jgi:hypothetical protein
VLRRLVEAAHPGGDNGKEDVAEVTVIAHVGGVPVEELFPTLAGTGTALLLARAWLSHYLRRNP